MFVRFVHARDVSDLGEVLDLVCYIVPHFVRRYAYDNSPCAFYSSGIPAGPFIRSFAAFLRNDLVKISRWAAETRASGPDSLKGLIEELHREVLRIFEVKHPFRTLPRINYFTSVRRHVQPIFGDGETAMCHDEKQLVRSLS